MPMTPALSDTVLTSLMYYPIKACRGFSVNESLVERMGLQVDRRMMVVTLEGRFLTQREQPRLAFVTPELRGENLTLSAPDFDALQFTVQARGTPCAVEIWKSKAVQAVDQGDEAAQWFSDWLSHPVRLVHIAEGYQRRVSSEYAINADDHTGFADGYPILMTCEESLEDLNSRLENPVPMNRFRPNIVVRAREPFAEDGWRRIRIADVEMAVVKPCARCVVTTIDKETLARSKEPLATLGKYRKHTLGAIFGQNVIPLNAGRLRVGMRVEVLA